MLLSRAEAYSEDPPLSGPFFRSMKLGASIIKLGGVPAFFHVEVVSRGVFHSV